MNDKMDGIGAYEDMLKLPHHVSRTRPRMTAAERAAQFSPFAALSGHGDAIRETERLTEQWSEPDESRKAELDRRLAAVLAEGGRPLKERPEVRITWFKADDRKSGGAYVTSAGRIRRAAVFPDSPAGMEPCIVMEDGEILEIKRIVNITCEGKGETSEEL